MGGNNPEASRLLRETYKSYGLCERGCGRELVTKVHCRKCAVVRNAYRRKAHKKHTAAMRELRESFSPMHAYRGVP